jgi:hypothetical protein
MAVVSTTARSGFETAIPVPQSHEVQALDYESFEVQALDAGGRVIGTSRPFSGSTQ